MGGREGGREGGWVGKVRRGIGCWLHKSSGNLLIICPPSKINLPLVECIIAEWEAKLMIVQCGVEIWAKVCMYVCKMSCYWAPHVNYAYKPPALDNV